MPCPHGCENPDLCQECDDAREGPRLRKESARYHDWRAALTWTDRPPTEPGWYWAEFPHLGEQRTVLAQVVESHGELRLVESRYWYNCPAAQSPGVRRWAGPIPGPLEPE